MKRSIILSLIAVAVLPSCKKDFAEASTDTYPLTFSVELEQSQEIIQTRAGLLEGGDVCIPMSLSVSDMTSIPETKSSLSAFVDSFQITALNEDNTPFITADGAYETVTYVSGVWALTGTYTWPGNKEKSFYAYANLPADGASVEMTAAHLQKLSYQLSTAGAMKDIFMGTYKGVGVNGRVPLTFYHPLTAVRFQLGEGTAVSSVEEVVLSGVIASGSALQDAGSPGSFSWTASSEVKTMSVSLGQTLYLIPQDLSVKKVKIYVHAVMTSGEHQILESTLEASSWVSGKINTYTLVK